MSILNVTAGSIARLDTLVADFAHSRPAAIALITDTERISYAELNHQAEALADTLVSVALSRGWSGLGQVAVLMDRSPRFVTAWLAVNKVGGVLVPIDPFLPLKRIQFMLDDSQCQLVLHEGFAEDLQMPHLECIDARVSAQLEPRELPAHWQRSPLMAILYTSGTTGTPKGVMLTHQGCMYSIQQNLVPLPRGLWNTPVSFVVTFSIVMMLLVQGSTLVIARPGSSSDQGYLFSWLKREQLYMLFLPPLLLDGFLEYVAASGQQHQLPSGFTVRCGSEALRVSQLRRFAELLPHCRLVNGYGCTEVFGGVSLGACDPQDPSAYIAEQSPGSRLFLLDKFGEPTDHGELWIESPALAAGYWQNSALTEARFVQQGANQPRRYRTGDVFERCSGGRLRYVGRMDNQIKIRGIRIEPAEIEEAILQHSPVLDAVAKAVEIRPGYLQLVAYVTPEDVDLVALKTHLASLLPGYMIPAQLVAMAQFPRNHNSKIDRHALPVPAWSQGQGHPPVTPLEQKVCAIFSSLLNVMDVRMEDDFFSLGGDSISSFSLAHHLAQTFEVRMEIPDILSHPTPASLCLLLDTRIRERHSGIDAAQPEAGASLLVLQPGATGGSQTPLVCIPGAQGTVLYLSSLAQALGIDRPFYTFVAPGLDGHRAPIFDVMELASRYCTELLEIQPDGPYFLAGHSFGGLVAFEMAQQLRALGRSVAQVMLFDSLLARPERRARPVTDSMAIFSLLTWFSTIRDEIVPITLETLTATAPDEQLQILQSSSGLESRTQVEYFVNVCRASLQAGTHYTPHPPDFPVTLFTADECRQASIQASLYVEYAQEDPTFGWRSICGERLTVVPTTGDHFSMLSHPHVLGLGNKVRELLSPS